MQFQARKERFELPEEVAVIVEAQVGVVPALQQQGTESTWTDILAWMQKNGGLWKLDPAVEKTIIGYLAANYGPGDTFRRAPIPLSLMPANPYTTEARLEAEAKKKEGSIPTAPPPSK